MRAHAHPPPCTHVKFSQGYLWKRVCNCGGSTGPEAVSKDIQGSQRRQEARLIQRTVGACQTVKQGFKAKRAKSDAFL